MAYFPVFMDVAAKKCMIFGGGKVALRKIETLIKFEADMEVVSLSVEEAIRELIPAEKIHEVELKTDKSEVSSLTKMETDCQHSAKKEESSENDIESWLSKADLVIAATSSREMNQFVTDWCHQHGVPVNVIDAPEDCTFLFPSIVKKGDITIGINTGGKSPIVSKKVRQGIEEAVPDYYGDIAEQLGQMREYVKAHFPEEKDRRKILKAVAAESFAMERALTEKEIHAIVEECRK